MSWSSKKKVVLQLVISLLVISLQNLSHQRISLAADIKANSSMLIPDTEDGRIYRRIVSDADRHNLPQESMGKIMQTVAEQFLGSEYRAGLLDQEAQETLVICRDGISDRQ
jgi:hypothetical protein